LAIYILPKRPFVTVEPRHYLRRILGCRAVFHGVEDFADGHAPHPSGLKTRLVEAGKRDSLSAGRMGRGTKFPPQFGQTFSSLSLTQLRQNVHSNVQIIASEISGGKSRLQHSQFGRRSNILAIQSGAGNRPNIDR